MGQSLQEVAGVCGDVLGSAAADYQKGVRVCAENSDGAAGRRDKPHNTHARAICSYCITFPICLGARRRTRPARVNTPARMSPMSRKKPEDPKTKRLSQAWIPSVPPGSLGTVLGISDTHGMFQKYITK